MAIGGELYPLHLAISSHWKVHYFSADMRDRPDHRAEDAAYLADPEAVLGSQVMATLARIAAALELDYAGIDFGLDAGGNVLLFEANAAMVVVDPGPEPEWEYRRGPVERVRAAVRALLAGRARR